MGVEPITAVANAFTEHLCNHSRTSASIYLF